MVKGARFEAEVEDEAKGQDGEEKEQCNESKGGVIVQERIKERQWRKEKHGENLSFPLVSLFSPSHSL